MHSHVARHRLFGHNAQYQMNSFLCDKKNKLEPGEYISYEGSLFFGTSLKLYL